MNIYQRRRAYQRLVVTHPPVTPTQLTFKTVPTSTVVGEDTLFVIEATDSSGQRDYTYNSTITLTSNTSNITSGGSGTMSNGRLQLSNVKFDTAIANDTVTASDGVLTNGTSTSYNIKYAAPSVINNLAIVSSLNSMKLTWYQSDPDANVLILCKYGNTAYNDATRSYINEAGMDDEYWQASTVYGTYQSPSDSNDYVVYAGSAYDNGTTAIADVTGLDGPYKKYSFMAYSYGGTLNSSLMHFNITEHAVQRSYTHP